MNRTLHTTWALALGVCLAGCRAHAPARAPVQPTAAPRPARACTLARDNTSQLPHAHDWVQLLVRLHLGRGGVYALQDCAARAIRPPRPRYRCPDNADSTEQPRPLPMAAESVIERGLGRDEHVIWVITHRFANGDGFGPLALARRVPEGLQVEALGTLRMRTERVQLERWRLQGETVISASGETCERNGQECSRGARLLVLRGTALINAPLFDKSGQCQQAEALELHRQGDQTLGSGLHRSYELTAVLKHDASNVFLQERLVVRDLDPRSPGQTPREVQHVEANRTIQARNGALFVERPSLWSHVLKSAPDLALRAESR